MSRSAVGAALGVAGTTVYLRPDIVLEWARNAAASGASAGSAALNSRDMDQLTKMVEQLAREVRSGGAPAPAIVVHSSDGQSRGALLLYVAVAVGAGALTLAAARGWGLGDLGWVSRGAFRRGVAGLSAGLDSLAARLADAKARLAARIAEVARKQDEAAAAAAAMHAHLADVGADVEAVRGQVGQVHAAVVDMEGVLADISANQRHALHGIYVLCKAVGELAAGSTIASKAELLEFAHSPVWQRVRLGGAAGPEGLQGILQPAGGNAGAGGDAGGWGRQRYALGRGEEGAAAAATHALGRAGSGEPAFLKPLPPRGGDGGGAGGSRRTPLSEFASPGAGHHSGRGRLAGEGVQYGVQHSHGRGYGFGGEASPLRTPPPPPPPAAAYGGDW